MGCRPDQALVSRPGRQLEQVWKSYPCDNYSGIVTNSQASCWRYQVVGDPAYRLVRRAKCIPGMFVLTGLHEPKLPVRGPWDLTKLGKAFKMPMVKLLVAIPH